MVAYCFDTNILVDYLRGNDELIKEMNEFILGNDIFITPVTLCELYRGAYGHKERDKKVADVNILASGFNLLDFDVESCKVFGEIYFEFKKKGEPVPEFDLMIASIVKSKGLTFITRDKKHFKGMGIKVLEW